MHVQIASVCREEGCIGYNILPLVWQGLMPEGI